MRLIIKGNSKKIISLAKELRIRAKRDDLEMVIQKTKTEESEERELQDNFIKAEEAGKAIMKSLAEEAETSKVDEIKKAEAERIAEIKAKAEVRARKDENAIIVEQAKADKKAKEKALKDENEKALEYVKSKMQKTAGITSESPKKARAKAKQD